jgi:hypothetical protein
MGLVEKLRTCPAEERREIAIELAKTGSENALSELKRMVEAERIRWLSWYNFNDQLIGIEALGETKRKEALDYLKSLLETTEVCVESSSRGNALQEEYWTDETIMIRYIHAEGELAEHLNCCKYWRTTQCSVEMERGRLNRDITEVREYQLINAAIQKLEKSLQPVSVK